MRYFLAVPWRAKTHLFDSKTQLTLCGCFHAEKRWLKVRKIGHEKLEDAVTQFFGIRRQDQCRRCFNIALQQSREGVQTLEYRKEEWNEAG
jgi:hypothetical protein